ncbi:MAG: DUF4384 domain-containing protein [Bacteroidaceae bacterium]|nr:DUF4384 domain-containing protein [Bacteroidaceae bacterium]
MMKCISLILTLLFNFLVLSAQRELTVSGSYTYYAPPYITLDQAKSIALERAKNEIIAEHFGTVVGVNSYSEVSNVNGQSSVKTLSLGESEVRGEWLETKEDPQYEVVYTDNFLVVKVTVRGLIREIKSARIDFSASILRNGTESRYESDTFKDGDDIFISFRSPVSGYLAIYLYDQEGVFRLLPMMTDKEGSIMVQGGVEQTFFKQVIYQYSASSGKTVETVKSIYHLVSRSESELNRIYIIFSPNKFVRPNDTVGIQEDLPPSLSFESFQHWLSRSRRQDLEMSVYERDIIINK